MEENYIEKTVAKLEHYRQLYSRKIQVLDNTIAVIRALPADLVIDLFAGSGNMLEVCRELDRNCIGVEISESYCRRIAEDMKIELEWR